MTTGKPLDKATVREIIEAAKAALGPVGERYGVSFSMGSVSFNDRNAGTKLEFALVGADGAVEDTLKTDFESLSHYYGLAPSDYGRAFTYLGRTYTVRGLKRTARKAPIVGARDDGTLFKFPVDTVKAALAKSSTD